MVARIRFCCSPSSVSMFWPSVRVSGEDATSAVNRSGWRATCWTSSQRVTSVSATAGMWQTGASARSRA